MAKQFIRHLEFYGFPDQNGYSSSFANIDVDLSDLRKKDKIHDKEIRCLENEKADKKDLLELSATVESFIDTQSQFNQAVVDELSGITSDIEKLKEIDNEYGEQLSALTNGVNDALCGVKNLGDRVDDIEEDLAELSGKVETFSAETKEEFEDVWEELDKKLDKTEAEETYAKKEDVPTKEELEETLEAYATKAWVEEQGYLDQSEGDARYARIETVNALNERVNSAVTDLNTKIYTVSGDLQSFSSSTNVRFGILETNFVTLSGATDRKINAISAAVESYDARITQNARDIDALEDEMARKANQSDLERLQNTVSSLSDRVDTKVSKTDFETYQSSVSRQFNDMDDKKLDKTAFTEALDAIDALSGAIDTEREERISGDTYILNEITNIQNEIIEIKEQAVDYGDRISSLESGLTKEIADRKQADLDLIGTSADTKDADTIWGAKAFAKNEGKKATTRANDYTDEEIANLRSEFEQDFEDIERELTAKADITYVDNSRNELKTELENEFNEDIQELKDDAEYSHNYLKRMIRENTRAIADNKEAIDHNSNSLHAITAWDAAAYDYDPQYYDDSGNGILDVLHREFHRYAASAGSIRDVRIEDGMLIIVYITPTGDQEVSTPITDIFDPNAYYTKEQSDVLLNEKADVSALTQAIDDLVDEAPNAYNTLGKIADYLTANTENIIDIRERISANTADIEANTSAITQNTEDIAQNTQDIDNLESGLTQANEDIDNLESGLTQANEDIDNLESGLTQANEDIDNLESGLTQANEDIDNLESGLTQANEDIAKNTEDIAENTSAITNINDSIDNINDVLETKADADNVPTLEQFDEQLATKADAADVQNHFNTIDAALETKANVSDVEAALSALNSVKVDKTDLDSLLTLYTTKTYVDAELAKKGDTTTINEQLATKANVSDVYTKDEANNKFLTEEDISSLATKDEVNEALATKADVDAVYTQEEVDEMLAAKDAEIDTIQTEYNKLKDMVLDLYYATTYSIPTDCALDSMLKSKNGEAKLTEDLTIGTIAAGTTAKNIVKLNLGGKTVTFTGTTTNNPAMMFRNKQQVNIGGSGTINANGRIAVEANGADCVVTLSGTMFGRPTYVTDRSGGELIYCYLGTINITEGIFKNLGENKTYLLNCYDANYRNGTAKIIVTGGKFYDFNPADNNAEGEHTSFVPSGYHVEVSTDGDSTVYTVKKD